MKCPSCSTEISDAVEVCEVCDFRIEELDSLAEGLPSHRPSEDVHDPGMVLSRQGMARLQERIDRFEEDVGAEFKVVILPSVKPLQPSEAAFWLFNRWSLGGEGNRAVLLLLATGDRKVQCEVGYGLEPFLSDEEAGRVLDLHVVPLLRRRSIDEALYQGVRLVAELIQQAQEEAR